MNIIKISEEVFETIQEADIQPIDKDHLPYRRMCIAFPYSFFRSADEMIEDSLKEMKKIVNNKGGSWKRTLEEKAEELEKAKQMIIDYCESDLYILFNIENWEITVKHSKPQIVDIQPKVLFNASSLIGIPVVTVNEMSHDGIWLYFTLIKLVSGVIYALTNTHVELTEDKNYTGSYKTKSKRKKRSNIRYITNVKHLSETDTNREQQKRIYTMEAWEVRGHWRHLQNGKKIWVSAYVKGDKEKFKDQESVKKLTKIQFGKDEIK